MGSEGSYRRTRTWTVCSAVGAVVLLAACQNPAARWSAANGVGDTSGYMSPPVLLAAARDASGVVTLQGQAPPDAEVRLHDPNGEAFSATADGDGSWSMQLPAVADARMFAFEAEVSGRLLHAEGAVLTLPAPAEPALLMRAGYGALPMKGGTMQTRIVSVDYDGAGGGSASGFAPPRSPVRLMLDGQPAGGGQADDDGRFTVLDLAARAPFAPGRRLVQVDSRAGAAQQALTVSPPSVGDGVFRATRDGDRWRVDWRIPGGGTQTTLVFDPPLAHPA